MSESKIPKLVACSVLAFAWSTHEARAQHWNQFRGPTGNGIAVGTQPLPAELDTSRNLLWKCAVRSGHSSPSVWKDRIFLTGCGGETLESVCVDGTNGRILWRREFAALSFERVHPTNSLASSTPATDGERVYVYFGSLGLFCYDFAGNELWKRPIRAAKNTFGTATSPIVVGDHLILNFDSNAESALESIDPETGETEWRTDRTGFKSGWSTPVHRRRGEVDELLVYGVWWLTAYDLSDGSVRWSVPGLSDEPIITPATGDGLVFVTSYNMRTSPEVIGLPEFSDLLDQYDADGNGRLDRAEIESNASILSRFDADGEGDHPLRGFFGFLDEDKSKELTEKEWGKMSAWLETFEHANALVAIRPPIENQEPEIVWQHPRGVPECPSPLYYDGRVYLVKNGGIASCLDAKTGELKFQERLDSRGPFYSSPVAGDGKVYFASARGVVTVIEAADSLKVLSRNDLGERIMATPALVDGVVYVRTESNLYAFGVPKER